MRSKSIDAGSLAAQLIGAATPIISEAGIRGATLRRVAAACGVPLSTITHEIGSKPDLVHAALQDVVRRDLERIEGRIAEVSAAGLDLFTAYHALWSLTEECWGAQRVDVLALFELLLKSGAEPPLAALCLDWLQSRRDLLRGLADRLGAPRLALDLLGLQLLAEAGFAISCGSSVVYRMIAAEGFGDAMTSVLGRSRSDLPAAPDFLAARFYETPYTPTGQGALSAEATSTRARLIDAVADLIQAGGIDQVAYRTVAAKAEVSPSLVAYYFATVDELAAVGMRKMFERLEAEIGDLGESITGHVFAPVRTAGPYAKMQELSGRGVMELSLAVARMAAPSDVGLELRRQRGLVTFAALRRRGGPPHPSRSRAASYSLSVTGAFLVLAAGEAAGGLYDFEALSRLAQSALMC